MRDPRIRQTLNQISDNIDSVTDTARTGCFTFTKSYIEPCLTTLSAYTPSPRDACPCCYADGNSFSRARNQRGRRGTAEYSFEFYNSDPFEGDDVGSRDFLGWGNDELDRLLAGSGAQGSSRRGGQRNDPMYYTTKGQRRKGPILPKAIGSDPTVIPKSSPFGFLWPWAKTRPTLRYKPSAADLQDHPGGYGGVGGTFRVDDEEGDEEEIESLLNSPMSPTEDTERRRQKQRRGRSGTVSSNETTDTFRSRTDLIPSEDEDDAVPLDDEFADALGFVTSPAGGKKSRKLRRTKTSDTTSTNERRSISTNRSSSGHKTPLSGEFRLEQDSHDRSEDLERPAILSIKSDEELWHEEEQARKDEEHVIQLKRQAAQKLAMQRGLSYDDRLAKERSESIASSSRARVQSLSSPRTSIEPVVMRDMSNEEVDGFSRNESDVDIQSIASTMDTITPDAGSKDTGLGPTNPKHALHSENDASRPPTTTSTTASSTITRPPLAIRAYTSLRLDRFIAATLSEVADSESVFTSPTSSSSSYPSPPPSPPILTKSYSENGLNNIPMQFHSQTQKQKQGNTAAKMNKYNKDNDKGDDDFGQDNNASTTWTTWLPPTSLEMAKAFLYKVGEEMVNNVNHNTNEADTKDVLGNGAKSGSSNGWDEEEAMVERWKETMGVLTDDEDDGEEDVDNDDDKSDWDGEEVLRREEDEVRRRGKRDESAMKFRMEEVVKIPRRR